MTEVYPIEYIYTLTSPLSKEIYVGRTTNTNRRLRQHKCCCNNSHSVNYNLKVYKHIRLTGFDNWELTIILQCSPFQGHSIEKECIQKWGTLNRQLIYTDEEFKERERERIRQWQRRSENVAERKTPEAKAKTAEYNRLRWMAKKELKMK